jgi:hypothetical protein
MLKDHYDPKASEADRSAAVDFLADELGKKHKSIVSKLSHMGLYRKPEKKAKDGKPATTKEKISNEICSRVGIEPDSSGLVKANKGALESILEFVKTHQTESEDSA